MCLILKKRSCIQTAKKDIVVYKVLVTSGNNEIISPYKKFTYELSKLNALGYPIRKIYDEDWHGYIVEEGFHSFLTIKDAENELHFWNFEIVKKSEIFKCVIPKGSKYYVGETEDDFKSYCSDQIIIVERL